MMTPLSQPDAPDGAEAGQRSKPPVADEEHGQSVEQLILSDNGRWHVTIVRSTQVFDLDAGTVDRFPGRGATYNPDNGPRRLRSIARCRVGAPGYWTLLSDDPSVDHYWQTSGTIKKIERIADEC